MNKTTVVRPDYGNWVSRKLIYAPSMVGIVFLLLALLFPILIPLAVFFFLIAAYFAYARYLFSPRGGNVQTKIRKLVLANLDWNGEGLALDIGCGNAALTVELAHKYPNAQVIGVDYWGKDWEYSQKLCEKNAKIEGVAQRVTFQSASASALPFEAGHFDAVVSNLTFHEVRDVKDKREAVKEALRMVRRGGKFVFQDLFLWKAVYGEVDDLLETIRNWGSRKVEFINTSGAAFIPAALKLPFMVGTIGIIYGEK